LFIPCAVRLAPLAVRCAPYALRRFALLLMRLSEFVNIITTHREFGETFVYHRHIPSQPAIYGPDLDLEERTDSALRAANIRRLYSHQVEAIGYLREGANIIVATPTASGKSLIYNLIVTETVAANRESRALYVFPLKALEQDQLKSLRPWLNPAGSPPITAAIYDGDTSNYQRKKIRSEVPNVVFTNPDMLHRGILPYHQSWERLFKSLSFVVLDEVHTYRGILGSHVHQVIRRLKRICRHYGSRPRFILLSATVSNPGEFGRGLVGEEVRVVRSMGAPRAGRHFVFLNPDASSNFSSAKLFAECLRHGFRTIAFTQSRKTTELIHLWVSQRSPELRSKISSYRAGFMPEERRHIERKLASGELLGVVSTSALEMGIDVGYLDICLLVGYPGTIINTWQRGGRVGRSGRESMVILIAKPDALDQYFMKHPDDLFERPYEAALLDPHNPYVVDAHLPCAAAEMPLTCEDETFWTNGFSERIRSLEAAGLLHRSAEGEPTWFTSQKNPHLSVDIRSTGETYTIFEKETGQAIGTVDGFRAFKECHPGAIYLHMARQYVVEDLALDTKDIIATRSRLEYFTRTRGEKETEILQVNRSRPAGQFIVREGRLKVTEWITGFEKRALPGQELIGVFPLEFPPLTFETVGFWLEIDQTIKDYAEKRGLHFMGGIHAIEHAAIGIFPLFALCDRNDLGGICYPYHPQLEKSAIFIYDGHPGGVGLAQKGYEIVEELLDKTLNHLKSCGCEEGCPSCIHSPKCGSGNKPLDKSAAILTLDALTGRIPLSEMVDTSPCPEPPPLSDQPQSETVDVASPRILYLDLETQRLADEVGGWQNTHLMRVSVVVVFDARENKFRVYPESKVNDLIQDLERADLIVGFNIKRFDYKVLSAYTPKDLCTLPTFDILEDIHGRLGFRLGLDHLARETLNQSKSADGIQAVAWFRKGETEKLTDYCRQDVAVTRDLFLYGLENGYLVFKEKKEERRLRLKVDWDLKQLLKKYNPSFGNEQVSHVPCAVRRAP
jgi:DEAD/DEAH box helicase domain-containing protein